MTGGRGERKEVENIPPFSIRKPQKGRLRRQPEGDAEGRGKFSRTSGKATLPSRMNSGATLPLEGRRGGLGEREIMDRKVY